MKKLIIVFVVFISFSAFAQRECYFKTIDSTGVTIVVPVYHSKVFYYFDDYEKKAMAQIQWAFDETATSLCMREYETKNPGGKTLLPEVDFPTLDAEVYQGLERVSLSIVAELGGQFHGQTDFIPVNYSAKAELIAAIKKKKNLLTIHGMINYQYEMVKKDVVAEFDCTKGNQNNGVVALHGRLGELILNINSLNKNEQVDRDAVLEDFMGTCVELKEEQSENLLGLSRKVKLVKGKFPVYGFVKRYQRESTMPFHLLESSFIEF